MNFKKNSIILGISSFFLMTGFMRAQTNVVFDLGGVFMDRNYKRICHYVGFNKLIRLALGGRSPQKVLFSLLDTISLPGKLSDEDRLTFDHRGRPCPSALLHWLKGDVSGREIIAAVNQYYDKKDRCGVTEENVMKRMVQSIFDPNMFIEMTDVYQRALDFLQECIDQGHNIYILSNLDRESCEKLNTMLPGFFELFDGVVISADVGLMKPNPAIFSYLLERYNLNPEETVFIDDQKENLKAAKEMGIFPIKCRKFGWFSKSPNFKKVKKAFKRWQD